MHFMKGYTCVESAGLFWPIEHNILKGFEVCFLCLSGDDSTASIHRESMMCFILFSMFCDEAEIFLINILVSKAVNEHPGRMFSLVICNLISIIYLKQVKIRVEGFDKIIFQYNLVQSIIDRLR